VSAFGLLVTALDPAVGGGAPRRMMEANG
jgi:hypothetical protein